MPPIRKGKTEHEVHMEMLGQSLLPESKMLDSEYTLGQECYTVQLASKNLRAYDLSSTSTEAMLLALDKERSSSCAMWFYSVWLWAFKA